MQEHQLLKLQQENSELKEKYEALLRKEKHLSVINSFATSLLEQNNEDDIVWNVAKNAVAKLGFIDCVIYLFDKEKKKLIQRAAHGPKNPEKHEIKDPIIIQPGHGIVGTVASSGKAELILDTTKDARYIVDDEVRFSEIAVPIIADEEVLGVIDSEHPEKSFYSSDDLEILTTIANITSTRLTQVRFEKQYKDSLEKIVKERTNKLETAIEKLKVSNAEINHQNKEKEVLLKEIHHRVKNNMQIIKSLINLQSNQVEDDKTLELFKECQSRIMSMAIIHEKLYHSEDLVHITIEDYVAHLTDNLIATYRPELRLKLDLKLEVYTFELNTIIPFGLLLNELISNALKHAFEGRKLGTLHIYLKSLQNNHYELTVGDDGVGSPEDILENDSGSLGIELIKTFVEQLDGTIEKIPTTGTMFKIVFQGETI
jgi:two-component sensor histidine kinase/putative methionine-R-sulfoxide reductase with GAF domain